MAEPIVAPMDAARWNAVKRSVEQIDELRDGGHHTAAAIMAATLADRLAELARDTRLPDYEQALRMRLITDVEPILSPERDLREAL